MAVIVKPTVSAKGIDRAAAEEIAEQASTLAGGEFASDGKTYATRKDANAMAAKYVRVIESLYSGVTLRSRTWEDSEGQWIFGIRPKDVKPEAAEEGEQATTPEEQATTPSKRGATASARK